MSSQIQRTVVIGLSGPSSSGKTTLARLLQSVFTPPILPSSPHGQPTIRSFILHEDDFYKTDDQIPVVTTSAGNLVQDWDTVDALDIPQFAATLAFIHDNGQLPAGLRSKEHLEEVTDSGVSEHTVSMLKDKVARRFREMPWAKTDETEMLDTLSLAFVDGFLLYSPLDQPSHPLYAVTNSIDIPLFLPASYSILKQRRESRSGRVTIGPAPTPKPPTDQRPDSHQPSVGKEAKDANAYTPEEVSFWTDPPGYVDDIVWPRYITDHAWLLAPQGSDFSNKSIEELKRLVGEGDNVRDDMGIIVAPGSGECPMENLLHWAVDEILNRIANMIGLQHTS